MKDRIDSTPEPSKTVTWKILEALVQRYLIKKNSDEVGEVIRDKREHRNDFLQKSPTLSYCVFCDSRGA